MYGEHIPKKIIMMEDHNPKVVFWFQGFSKKAILCKVRKQVYLLLHRGWGMTEGNKEGKDPGKWRDSMNRSGENPWMVGIQNSG